MLPVAAINLSSLENDKLVISSLNPLNICIGFLVLKSHNMTGASGVFAFRDPIYPDAIYFPLLDKVSALISISCALRNNC